MGSALDLRARADHQRKSGAQAKLATTSPIKGGLGTGACSAKRPGVAHVTGARQMRAPGRKPCAHCRGGPGPGGIHPKPPTIGNGMKGAQTVIPALTLSRHIAAIHPQCIHGRADGAGPQTSWCPVWRDSDCSPGILRSTKALASPPSTAACLHSARPGLQA